MKKAYLILEDGKIFKGQSFGAEGTFTGEVVFNTAMSGYQEILTDPSYFGQVVVMTYPMIGNYGINKDDSESDKIFARALVVKEYHKYPSNWQSTMSLADFLKKNGTPGIEGIDTRTLVRYIREKGTMRAAVSTETDDVNKILEVIKNSPQMSGLNLADEVSSKKSIEYKVANEKFRVSAYDFGIKKSIIKNLNLRGITVKLFPSSAKAQELLDYKPNGLFLSNGPGDPAAVKGAIDEVKVLLNSNIPLFGICLGHQILCLAVGAQTYKFKFGHHGGNHPVQNLATRHVEISSQNHGFAVDPKSLSDDIEITHLNLNDKTIEGIKSKTKPWMSIQYHPEASPGPCDSSYIFDEFVKMIEDSK